MVRARAGIFVVATLAVLTTAFGVLSPTATAAPAFITGFEHGTVSSAGAGLFSGIGPNAPTIQSSVVRSGDYAMQCVGAGDDCYVLVAPNVPRAVVRFAIRFETLPGSDLRIFQASVTTGSDFEIQYVAASQRLRAQMDFGGSNTSLATVSADQWYVIDVMVRPDSNPRTMAWQIDGIPQPHDNLSNAEAPEPITEGITLPDDTQPGGHTLYIDDLAVSTTASDYPLGDAQILGIRVDGQGSHSLSGNFRHQSPQAAIDGTSHQRIDDDPMSSAADWIEQVTRSATAYLEWTLQDAPLAEVARAARAVVAVASNTNSSDTAKTIVVSEDGTATTVQDDNSQTSVFYGGAMLNEPADGWTQEQVDGTLLQTGYNNTNSRTPRWHSFLMELEYAIESAINAPAWLFTNDTDAQAGNTNPTKIGATNPHFSLINMAGEDVDAQRVQVAQPHQRIPNDVIAHWRMNGTLVDETGNGHDATFGTNPNDPSYVAGKAGFGQAVHFDGESMSDADYATVAHDNVFNLTSEFTIEAWIQSPSEGGPEENYIIARGDTDWDTHTFAIRTENQRIQCMIEDDANFVQGPDIVSPGNIWYHVACTWDNAANALTLYVNGVEVDSASPSVSPSTGTWPVIFGDTEDAGPPPTDGYFLGSLDEIRIWSRELSAPEVAEIYATGKPPTYPLSPGTVSWDSSPMDDGQPLDVICATATRCEDIVYDVDGSAGTATPLSHDGSRYFVRGKYLTAAGNEWSAWSDWDWFETAIYPGEPQGLFVDDDDASLGAPNPTTITSHAPVMSWLNQQGEDVDRAQVQVKNTSTDDAVVLWHMDGNGTDASGNGRTLSLAGSPADPAYINDSVNASFDRGLQFDSNDRATASSHSSLDLTDDFTVDMWFRRNGDPASDASMIEKGGSLNRNYHMYVNPTGRVLGMVTVSGSDHFLTTNPSTFTDNQWHHAAMVVTEDQTLRLFVDGVQYGGDLVLGGAVSGGMGTGLTLGRYHSVSSGFFGGDLDEVRITARAMSPAEIRGYYVTNLPHDTTLWDSGTANLSGTCLDQSRCPDIAYGGSAGSLVGEGRYHARIRFRTPLGGSDTWTSWSTWDWFQMQGEIPEPSDQFVHETDASAGDTRPTDIAVPSPHFSWVNNAGEDVDRQQVQVVTTPIDEDVLLLLRADGSDPSDSSGNGRDATPAGGGHAPTYELDDGPNTSFGDAFKFDGDDYFTVASDTDLDGRITIETWFRTPSIAGRPFNHLLKREGMQFSMEFDRDAGNLRFGVRFDDATHRYATVPAGPLVNTGWHHAAGVVDDANNRIRLYVNGELVDNVNFPSGITPEIGSPNDLWVGGSQAANDGTFTGELDDIRWTGRVLDDDEIAAIYASQRPHGYVLWESADETGEALDVSCGAERCEDIVYDVDGNPDTAEPLLGDSRYYARARFMTESGGAWSEWSDWDWFETVSAMHLDLTDCQTGSSATTFEPLVPGDVGVTPDDCSVEFGSSGSEAVLRVYQADEEGDAAWRAPHGPHYAGFNGNGIRTHDPTGTPDSLAGVAAQPDGAIVGVGQINFNLGAVRYLDDGTADPGFGTNGVVDTGFGNMAHDVALQEDGKIVLAGYSGGSAALYRMHPDGDPDTDSDSDPTIHFSDDGQQTWNPSGNDEVGTVVHVLANGKILMGGYQIVSPGTDAQWFISRWNSDGTLDTTFSDGDGSDGYDIRGQANKWDWPWAMAVDASGRIVMVGKNNDRMAAMRWSADGDLDTGGFGVSGVRGVDIDGGGGNNQAMAVGILHDGSIVMGGLYSEPSWSNYGFAATMLDDEGDVVTSYGDNGHAYHQPTTSDEEGMAGVVYPDGSIALVGYGDDLGNEASMVVMFDGEGNLDTRFGGGTGVDVVDLDGARDDMFLGAAVGVDGRLVAVGERLNASSYELATVQYATSTLPPYDDAAGDDWETADAFAFGACLRLVENGAQDDTDTWAEAPGNVCTTSDGTHWNPLAADASDNANIAAETTGSGIMDAVARLRFGARLPSGSPAGATYFAPVIIESVNPNL